MIANDLSLAGCPLISLDIKPNIRVFSQLSHPILYNTIQHEVQLQASKTRFSMCFLHDFVNIQFSRKIFGWHEKKTTAYRSSWRIKMGAMVWREARYNSIRGNTQSIVLLVKIKKSFLFRETIYMSLH